MKRGILSVLLVISLCLAMFPAGAMAIIAADNTGLCPHHTEHTSDCGYIPASGGTLCTHEHTEDCYALNENCNHIHDENCYTDGVLPTVVGDKEADACVHVCGEDSGCVILTEDCVHAHDEPCGYGLPLGGEPCGYICEICEGVASETEAPENTAETTEAVTPSNDAIMPMVFVTGTIPAEMFEISGLPEGVIADEFLADWSYTADGRPIEQVPVRPDGSTPASRFPEYKDYHFVSVTIDNVVATQLGILQLSEFTGQTGNRYYYLTSTVEGYESSSTVLADGKKFTINYAHDEYDISYKVSMADGGELPDGVDLDSTFGFGRPTVTTNQAYSFDVRIPYGYTAQVYRYWTDESGTEQCVELTNQDHNNGYPLGTEPVYVLVDSSNIKVDESQGPKTLLVNDTFYDDNVTEHRDIVVVLTKSEAPVFDAHLWLQTPNAGTRGSVAKNKLAEDGVNYEPNLNSAQDGNGNVQTEDSYNWRSNSSIFYKAPGSLSASEKDTYATHWYQNTADGTWTLVWAFQTNGDDNYVLNGLALNGQSINIPFKAQYVWTGGKNGNDTENTGAEGISVTTTTLQDGATVTLTFYREFATRPQRVYILKITGAKTNITITGGNLMQYASGAPEFIANVLVGVTGDDAGAENYQAYVNGWETLEKEKPRVLQSNANEDSNFSGGDSERYFANLRFKLQAGYENPVYLWEDRISGADLEGSTLPDGVGLGVIPWEDVTADNSPYLENGQLKPNAIYGPDGDGWYYIRVMEIPGSAHKMCVVSITATPIKYVVRYLPGEVKAPNDGTMPEFEPTASGWDTVTNRKQYDDNGGNYYDVATNNIITVDARIPVDPEQDSSITGRIFQYWTLVGTELAEDGTYKPLGDIRIYPSQALQLKDELTKLVAEGGYSFANDGLGDTDINVRVLRLQAVWAPTPDKFSYTIWIEYIDGTGERHRELVPADVIETENDFSEGEKLIVGVNLDAPVFVEWLKNHPYYHFDPNNKDVYEIDDEGEIVVTFVPKNGALVLEKRVVGDPGSSDTFTFTIDGPDNLSENFLAWPADLPIEERTEADMVVVHFENGNAQVQLKGGQRIVLYVPPGDYTITEENIAGADYRVNVDGEYVADGEPAQITRTVTFEEVTVPVVFTNVFDDDLLTGNLTVHKTVTGSAGELDRAFHFAATIGGRTYEFTLKDGESWTSGLFTAGTEYTVTEADANKDGYTTTVPVNATGTIQGDQTVSVEFVNHKDSSPPETDPTPGTDPADPPVNPPLDDAPKTGDESQIGLWMLLMLLSLTAIVTMVTSSRKTKLLVSKDRRVK